MHVCFLFSQKVSLKVEGFFIDGYDRRFVFIIASIFSSLVLRFVNFFCTINPLMSNVSYFIHFIQFFLLLHHKYVFFFLTGKLKFHDMFLNDKQQKNAECNKYITN